MFFISDKSKTLFVEVRHYWQIARPAGEVMNSVLRSSYEVV